MSNSEEKVPKTNGLGVDPFQRLASFKTPRDLSLGGVRPNKKVFTPNLNVTRNKNKSPAINVREQKNKEKEKKERRNDRNRNIKNGPNIIKSSGVFAEGLGSAERHSTRASYGRDSDSSAVIRKPTIRVKDVIKIDKELEDQQIKAAVGGSNFNEDDISEDFKQALELDAPIRLPIDDCGHLNIQTKSTKIKQEVVVKREPDNDAPVLPVEHTPLVDIKKEVFEDSDVANLLQKDEPTLILLQLPDTLPGRGGSSDDDAPRRKHNNEPSTSGDQTEKPADDRCYLSNLEEGRIGKLLVHRSGRVTLALGDTKLEVCSGTKWAFHQEVVSVAADDQSRAARLVSLGPLKHKLCAVPDWEVMFADMPV